MQCLVQLACNGEIYSKTCVILQLCNPLPCIIRRLFVCSFDKFLIFALLNPTPCLFQHKLAPYHNVWHARESKLFNGHECRAYVKRARATNGKYGPVDLSKNEND